MRCPKEIEDQEHEQVRTSERPAIVCERDRREHLRMDPGSGSAPGPAACTPSRSPARPPIDPPKRIQGLAATR
jgi:hypothetical protein